nr:hypothetical protein [Kibdelosporangium sp. MJ126-NF4]
MTVVPRVFLHHVQQHPAQRDSSPVTSRSGAVETNWSANKTSARHASHAPATITASAPATSNASPLDEDTSTPAITRRNQNRSDSAACRSSPSKDNADLPAARSES